MKKIIIDHKAKKRIKDALNTSYPTIRLALVGGSDTDLAKRIRAKALELGGVEADR